MIICIDPGHGGQDPGAGSGQYMEKTYALAIAKRLGEKLKADSHEVIYTRRSDAFISLSGRCQFANERKADLFIAIHLNAAASPAASGIETFAYGTSGKGYRLATCVQEAMIRATGEKDRGVKNGKSFAVLRGTEMPAILIETGFISNYHDLKKLITCEYQEILAAAILEGVRAYLGTEAATKNKNEKTELVTPNDIVWQLHAWGIVTDPEGMLAEMKKDPDGRLYHLAQKCVNRLTKAS